jgi:hypothetical protein
MTRQNRPTRSIGAREGRHKNNKETNTKAANSPHWGDETTRLSAMNFAQFPNVTDVINAKYDLGWSRGFEPGVREMRHLPLEASIAYITTALR